MYGAGVVLCDPEKTSQEEVAEALWVEHGYTLIPPYNHPDVVTGQGSAALEMFEELSHLDALLAPCGGGGLLSGSAIAAKGWDLRCQVIGIEPELADDETKSFCTKELQTLRNPPTIADGTRTPSLGTLTFPQILQYVDAMKTVSEAVIMEAVRFHFDRMKIVVEPSGVLGQAAMLSWSVSVAGRVGVIVSGGNIDGSMMRSILDS